jgi:alpha-tubulin suppressor-like RCC1 family protein
MPQTAIRHALVAMLLVGASVVLTRPTVVDADADANVVALQPARLLDTRTCAECSTIDGRFLGGGPLGAGARLTLDIAGRGGVDPDADAVMLNVTAVFPGAPGYLTVFPCTAAVPNASNVNYFPGDVAANAVLAKLSDAGQVCIYSLAGTHVVVDVTGYVPPAGAPVPVEPARLVETRGGAEHVTVDGAFQHVGRLPAGGIVEFPVWGRGQPGDAVPANAQAVYLNVTAVYPDAPGFLTVYPCTASVPNVSNVNYAQGDVAPNSVLATVSPGGTVCIYSSAAADVIADVNGYLPPGGNRVAINPARCADTRTVAEGANTFDGLFLGHGRLRAGETYAVTIAGRCNVAGDASAAYVNVTAVYPSTFGYLTVWPCDQPRPETSNVNYLPGAVQPNSVLAKISLDGHGKICIYSLAETHVIVDANGYVPAPGLAGIVQLGVGSAYSCARHTDGVVRCVGSHDTIGAGPRELGATYTPVPVIGVGNATDLDVGDSHACAVLADRTLRCWGHNDLGQLGDGTTAGEPGYGYVVRQTPVQPPVTGALDVSAAGAWSGFTCAIVDVTGSAQGDQVQCWGDNYFGQLGFGYPPATPANLRRSTVPVTVAGLPAGAYPVEIEAGDAGACVRMSNGSVWCWGQVLTASTTPVLRTLATGQATDIDVGRGHACAVTTSGAVECWGAGTIGQLGNGQSANSATPVVASVTGAVTVATGLDSTCVTLTSGGARCWGYNLHAQLGNGTSTSHEPSPVPVTVVTGSFTAAATGNSSTCVLMTNTTAKCWGYNLGGQLGVRVNGNSAGPVVWGSGNLT